MTITALGVPAGIEGPDELEKTRERMKRVTAAPIAIIAMSCKRLYRRYFDREERAVYGVECDDLRGGKAKCMIV